MGVNERSKLHHGTLLPIAASAAASGRGSPFHSLVPGRSVAEVARAHEVNANQVFDWRKQYLEGRLDPKREDGLMLPVVLSEPDEKEKASAPSQTHTSAGVLRVLFARSEVRIEGHVDPDALRVVMQCLSR